MSLPLIGVTCEYEGRGPSTWGRHHSPNPYAEAVEEAGGLAVFLAVTSDPARIEEIVDRLDGILLSGGPDIPPSAYGAKRDPKTKPMERRRFEFESLLLRARDERPEGRRLPVLGICLGCQMVNVHRGGTLVQHLDTGLRHQSLGPGRDAVHPAALEPAGLRPVFLRRRGGVGAFNLAWVLGGLSGKVNSAHHQAAQRPGGGLAVLARAKDGTIEALAGEGPDFFLGIQWHPERIADAGHRGRLFRSFVAACAGARRK